MIRFIAPSSDATIYEHMPSHTTGLDEILEVGKGPRGSTSIRSLIRFNMTDIADRLPDGVDIEEVSFRLSLRNANAYSLNRDQEVLVHPLTTDWDEGSGYLYQDHVNADDGPSWQYAEGETQWGTEGGDFDDQIEGSQQTTWPMSDWEIDVSDVVRSWFGDTPSPNYGMILKFPDPDEQDSSNEGVIKLFSSNTHTIYGPKLLIMWDDQEYEEVLDENNEPVPQDKVDLDRVFITFRNLQPSYKKGEVVRMNIRARNRYPVKGFQDQFSRYEDSLYLPEKTYYSVVDLSTDTTVIPFSDATKVSSTQNGPYFFMSTEPLHRLRTYKIIFKMVSDETNQHRIIDNRYHFRIER